MFYSCKGSVVEHKKCPVGQSFNIDINNQI